jgi:hypothetical protein
VLTGAVNNEEASWSADKSWEKMDDSNVDRLLDSSIRPSTASKYGKIWDKWVTFAAYHETVVMPPYVRALEIFFANTANFSGSTGVATTAAAAVAHFCALEGYESLFVFPRFGKILRGIKNEFSKPVRPKKPFTPDHIVGFMVRARSGTLNDWRAALPLVHAMLPASSQRG